MSKHTARSNKEFAPLPIVLKKNELVWNTAPCLWKREQKKIDEYRTFFSRQTTKEQYAHPLYRIYRNAVQKKDVFLFSKHALRHDLTLLLPSPKNSPLPTRTIGHVHKKNKAGVSYPELYCVIKGTALFLLENKRRTISLVARCSVGEKIIIPPEYGHIIINASAHAPAIVANLFTSKKNVSDYSFFKKSHGPSWIPLWSKKEIYFVKNEQSVKKNSVKNLLARQTKVTKKGVSLYASFIKNPSAFDFLNHPEHHRPLLEIL